MKNGVTWIVIFTHSTPEVQAGSWSQNYFATKNFKSFGVLVFFDRFVDVTSLDNITNVVKGKSNVDAAIVNVAETKSYY